MNIKEKEEFQINYKGQSVNVTSYGRVAYNVPYSSAKRRCIDLHG